MPDKRIQHKEIPLEGKWYTTEPATIGDNFQTLTNLRYKDRHLQGVKGMTAINVTAMTTCLITKNAFHFNKFQPAESHVLAQVQTTAGTTSEIKENTAAIPATAAFTATAIWTDSSGFGLGRFSDAPDGQMIYCNGVDSCIWGGDEMKLGSFLTSTAAVTDSGSPTSPKDYTDILNNTKTDADNIAIIGGGIDSYTKLLMHMDADDTVAISPFIDDAVGTHTPVAVADAQADISQSKFGLSSALFDGTGDYITIPDHDDWKMDMGSFTIDFWVRFNSVGINHGFFTQYVDATHYAECYFLTASKQILFSINDGGVYNASVGYTWADVAINTWYHVAIVRDAGGTNEWMIFINGVLVATDDTPALEWPQMAAPLLIGAVSAGGGVGSIYFNGWMDEFRISKGIARWTATFAPPTRPYMLASRTWLVGSPRPIQGLKYTVSLGNDIASTMTGSEWNGTTWNTLAITDNTDTGASLAITGTVTFNSTVDTAKPKYIGGYFLYWYQFTIDDGYAELSHVTIDAPFQGIVDMWDGVFRDVARFYKYTTAYIDNTINVLMDDYDATSAYTYSDLSSMAAFSAPNNCLEIGFTEKQTGLKIDVAPEYTNSTAATTMAIDYWDGTTYVSTGVITDGTSEGAISLAKSGVVTWNNNSLSNETLKVVSNSPPLYYYRVRFDKAMDASVRVNYVGGISAQKDISYFKFPMFAQGRVFLCADMAGEKNKAIVSSKYMPQVYNGIDTVDVYFGEEGELTCGTELFSQFGASLYSLILMFKDTEMWVVAGQSIDLWENNTFPLSNSIGCPAPLTLKTINLSASPGQGINRNLAIWQGANGVYMSDGRAPIPIHGDIKEYFDPLDSRCITASKIGDSVGFIDPVRQEYHLLIASGTAATDLNVELVYDIARNKWFRIDRTYDQYTDTLQCGVCVHDTDGNAYNYGFFDTGYMLRLENGTTFYGAAITHTFQFGDMALGGLGTESKIGNARLITVAKTVTDQNVTMTHYPDGATAGTDFTLSPVNAGYRLAQPHKTDQLHGDPFHSLKFTITTDDEVTGFEPIAVVIAHHPTHQDN